MPQQDMSKNILPREIGFISVYGVAAAISTVLTLKGEGIIRRVIPAAITAVTGKLLYDEIFPYAEEADYNHID